jgi:hypothetical protein
MLKPPAANMPGMTDTLDFVKNLWGSMNLPGTEPVEHEPRHRCRPKTSTSASPT